MDRIRHLYMCVVILIVYALLPLALRAEPTATDTITPMGIDAGSAQGMVRTGPSSNESTPPAFDRIKNEFAELFSELTGLKKESFEVRYDYSAKPDHIAAIVPSQRQRDRRSAVRRRSSDQSSSNVKPILYVSHQLLDLLDREVELRDTINNTSRVIGPSDDRLEWVLLHEFFHEITSDDLQRYLENPENWRNGKPGDWAVRERRNEIEQHGSKASEIRSDTGAQEYHIERGGSPNAGVEVLEIFKGFEGNPPPSLYQDVKGSHPRANSRQDALQANETRAQNNPYLDTRVEQGEPRTEVTSRFRQILDSDEYKNEVRTRVIDQLNRSYRGEIETAANAGPDFHRALEGWVREGTIPYDPELQSEIKAYQEGLNEQLRRELQDVVAKRIVEWANSERSLKDRMWAYKEWRELLEKKSYLIKTDGLRTAVGEAIQINDQKLREQAYLEFFSEERQRHYELERLFDSTVATGLPGELLRDFARLASEKSSKKRRTLLKRAWKMAHRGGNYWANIYEDLNIPAKEGEARSAAFRFTPENYLTFLETFLEADPIRLLKGKSLQDVLTALKSLEVNTPNIEEYRAQAREILQDAINRIPTETSRSFEPSRVINPAQELGLDISSLRGPILRQMELRYGLENVLSDRRYPNGHSLFEIYEKSPHLRDALTPLISEWLELFELKVNDPEKFAERLVELRRGNKSHDRRHYSTPERHLEHEVTSFSFDFLQSEIEHDRTDATKNRLKEVLEAKVTQVVNERLQGSAETLVDFATSGLREIGEALDRDSRGDRGGRSRRAQQGDSAIRNFFGWSEGSHVRTPDGYAIQWALLNLDRFPDLREFLAEHRWELLDDIGRWGLRGQRFRRLMRVLYPDQGELRRYLLDALVEGKDINFGRFESTFGISLKISDVHDLSIPANKKVEIISNLRLPTTDPKEAEVLIMGVMRQAGNEWYRNSLSNADYLQLVRDVERMLVHSGSLHQLEQDRAFYQKMSLFRQQPYFAQVDGLTELLFTSLNNWSAHPYEEQIVERLMEIIPSSELDRRFDLFERGHVVRYFRSDGFVHSLFEDVMANSQTDEIRLDRVKRMNSSLNVQDLNAAWDYFFEAELRNRPYDESKTSSLIRTIYENYTDGMFQKINTVSKHFELDEAQMRSLRQEVFQDNDVLRSYKTAEIVRLAIEKNMSKDPLVHLEFIHWLQGRVDTPPEMAEKVKRSLHVAAAEFYADSANEHITKNISKEKFVALVAENVNLEKLRDLYQNNGVLGRALMVSAMVTQNNELGLLATPEGIEAYLDYATDGVAKENVSLARILLSSYLKGLGRKAHLFGSQVMASDSGRNHEMSDAEKIKAVMEQRGSLWMKLGQQLYGDRYLIPDDAVREVFRQLLDNAAEPLRPDIFQMLRDELGAQYEKIEHVGDVRGSGSINVSVSVIINGKRYIARMVKGDPWQVTQAELEVIDVMVAELRAEAEKTHDSNLKVQLRKIAISLEEYVVGIAEKIEAEADFEIERAVAKRLIEAGAYNHDFRDLNVRVEMVREATETGIEFSSQTEKGGQYANRKRIIFYPEVPDIYDELTPAEQLRVRTAMARSEWGASMGHGMHDPDGHLKNWRVDRDPSNPDVLILRRIDISQAELFPAEQQGPFKELLRAFFRAEHPILSRQGTPDLSVAFENYARLVDTPIPHSELETIFREAWEKTMASRVDRDPISLLVELQANMKERTGGLVQFTPRVRMAMKSFFTSRQFFDPRIAREREAMVREFSIHVLGRGTTESWLWGLVSRFIPNRKKQEVELAPIEERHENLHSRLEAMKSRATISDEDRETLLEIHRKYPEHRSAIRDFFENRFEAGVAVSQNTFDFLVREYGADSAGFDELLRRAILEGGNTRAVEHVLLNEKSQLYDAIYERFLISDKLQYTLANPEKMPPDFMEYFQRRVLNESRAIPISHFLASVHGDSLLEMFPFLEEEVSRRVMDSINETDKRALHSWFHTGHNLSEEAQRAYVQVFIDEVERERQLDTSTWVEKFKSSKLKSVQDFYPMTAYAKNFSSDKYGEYLLILSQSLSERLAVDPSLTEVPHFNEIYNKRLPQAVQEAELGLSMLGEIARRGSEGMALAAVERMAYQARRGIFSG